MFAVSIHPLLRATLAEQASPAPVAPWQRLLGGAGLLILIVVLLSLPLLIALRNAARRRRAAAVRRHATPAVDAWRESARRMKDPA